jgi:hypothetical protein
MSVATVAVQAVLNVLLLQREFGRRLKFDAAPGGASGAAVAALK